MKNYRHGDVDIKSIDKLPENLKKQDNLTLALGEVTGHHHTLVCDKPNMVFVLVDSDGTKYIDAKEDCILTHQEHETIKIEKGMYVVKIEQEYDPFAEEIKKVQD